MLNLIPLRREYIVTLKYLEHYNIGTHYHSFVVVRVTLFHDNNEAYVY